MQYCPDWSLWLVTPSSFACSTWVPISWPGCREPRPRVTWRNACYQIVWACVMHSVKFFAPYAQGGIASMPRTNAQRAAGDGNTYTSVSGDNRLNDIRTLSAQGSCFMLARSGAGSGHQKKKNLTAYDGPWPRNATDDPSFLVVDAWTRCGWAASPS